MSETTKNDERGWAELFPKLSKANTMLSEASEEDQFREVSNICFDVLLALARLAYDPAVHGDEEDEAEDDATGMDPLRAEVHHKLKPVIRYLFPTSKQKPPRIFVINALKHAMKLHQKKAGTYKGAAQCLVSTTAVVNMVAAALGRRLDIGERAPALL